MQAKYIHAKASDERVDTHFIAVWNLRVWVREEDGWFFAQGLEVDYAAQGSTRDEVMQLFKDGFAATIDDHLRVYGTIEEFLRPVSAQVMMDFNARMGDAKPLCSVSIHIHPVKKTADIPEVAETNIEFEFYELPKAA